mgnify:CR=1 FL=1
MTAKEVYKIHRKKYSNILNNEEFRLLDFKSIEEANIYYDNLKTWIIKSMHPEVQAFFQSSKILVAVGISARPKSYVRLLGDSNEYILIIESSLINLLHDFITLSVIHKYKISNEGYFEKFKLAIQDLDETGIYLPNFRDVKNIDFLEKYRQEITIYSEYVVKYVICHELGHLYYEKHISNTNTKHAQEMSADAAAIMIMIQSNKFKTLTNIKEKGLHSFSSFLSPIFFFATMVYCNHLLGKNQNEMINFDLHPSEHSRLAAFLAFYKLIFKPNIIFNQIYNTSYSFLSFMDTSFPSVEFIEKLCMFNSELSLSFEKFLSKK